MTDTITPTIGDVVYIDRHKIGTILSIEGDHVIVAIPSKSKCKYANHPGWYSIGGVWIFLLRDIQIKKRK